MEQENISIVSENINVRIPIKYKNIQYNFCKNPNCINFGVEPIESKKEGRSLYMMPSGGKHFPLLKCVACGEAPPLKSNHGIVEELERITSYLRINNKSVTCPDINCSNHKVSVETKKAYRRFGTTKAGAKRFLCLVCNKTFSIAQPTQYQHETHKNIDIFKMLVNKVPLSRIVHMAGVLWSVLYNRIDFIHKQCLAFAADREIQFLDLPINRVYISVDKQDYMVNWTERKDKRNIILTAISSVDNNTNYVFGINPNFDPTLDKSAIENNASMNGDNAIAPPYRKYARLWLEVDYDKSINNPKGRKIVASLEDEINNKYSETQSREDLEAFDEKMNIDKLPEYGFQVHSEYTMIAHMYFLKALLRNVGKFRFFLDQESGIRSAFMSAFKDEISTKHAEAFYVSIAKGETNDEKEKLVAKSYSKFREIKKNNPQLNDEEIKLMMLKAEINNVSQLGKYQDKWVNHPLPSKAEAEKKMCWLTEHQDYDLDHIAWLYNKASLHGVDSFFQKIRRRIAMLERPIHSSANRQRTWNGYAPYNPNMVIKMLEIFRVVHNYVDVKKEKGQEPTTPATRIGLAKAPLDYKDILYFQ